MSRPDPRALIAEARERHGYLEGAAQLGVKPEGHAAAGLRRIDALLAELADALEAHLPTSPREFKEGEDVEVVGKTFRGSDEFIGLRGFVAADGPDSDGDVTITMYYDLTLDVTFPASSLELL